MSTLLSVIPIVVRRVAANGRLLAAVVIGAVLAAALMSTTSIYTDAIRDLGLSYAIRQRGPDKINMKVASNSRSSLQEGYEKDRDFIDGAARNAFGPLIKVKPTETGLSQTFFPTPPGGSVSPAETRPRSNLQFWSNLEPHVRVVEGRMPRDTGPASINDPAPQIEAALGGATARRLNVKAGDRFDLHPFWTETEPVHLTVVGIIDPIDANDPYFLGSKDAFEFVTSNWDTYPFFVTQATYFGAVAGYLPNMTSDVALLYYLNTSPVDARNAKTVRENIRGFGRTLEANVQRTTIMTDLPDVLETFDQKLFFTRIPLLVLVLQIAGIVMYYLFMVSTMLVERQQSEISLFKSRGATTAQVMQIYVIEGLVILLIAMALGPPLAAFVIGLLGRTPPFTDLSGGANLSVHLSAAAYLWALSGAVLAYLMLLVPAYKATSTTVVQQRTASARPPREAAFTRYYIDLVLVALGGVLFYQLNRTGALHTDKLIGEQSIDPVKLLTPAFFILTVGIVFLRLFPLVLRGLAWVVARLQGTAVLIGMWQLVRNPTHYSRLVLLLMLATAVGMFAASFGATLDRSYADRAAYQSGSQLRVSEIRRTPSNGPGQLAESIKQQTGAEHASAVLRLSGSQGTGITRNEFAILGVDSATFADVGYFRDDFAAASLRSLMAKIAPSEALKTGPSIPANTRTVGIWVNPVDLKGRVGIDLYLRDSFGRYMTVALGPEGGVELPPEWSFLTGDVTRVAPGGLLGNMQFGNTPPTGPFEVVSLSVRFVTRVSAVQGTVQLDGLQYFDGPPTPAGVPPPGPAFTSPAVVRFPNWQMVADFETTEAWEPMQGMLPVRLNDSVRTVPSGPMNAIELTWRPVQGNAPTHGLRPRLSTRDEALPVVASDGFLKTAGLKVGDVTPVFLNGTFFSMRIEGTFSLFPTLQDPRERPAVVADLQRLQQQINLGTRSSSAYPDEVWLGGVDAAGIAKARELVAPNSPTTAKAVSLDELRESQKKDPLVAAGWQGILFLSFAAILILSAIGFLIYSYLTAQKRTLEFAVLRTMGFSRFQIATVVGFEQCFVIGLGMLAGSLMGLRLGSLMINYMGVTETGDSVLPPMALHVSWLTAATALAVLGSVFFATIGVVVLMYSRLALHRVLRIGET
jgi:ABC-type antimicrobial peptide transport system permease subunit